MKYTIPRLQSLLWPMFEYTDYKIKFCFKRDAGKGTFYVDLYGDREAILAQMRAKEAEDAERAKRDGWYSTSSWYIQQVQERLVHKRLPSKGIRRMVKLGYIRYESTTKCYIALSHEERIKKFGIPGRVLQFWNRAKGPNVTLKQDSRRRLAKKRIPWWKRAYTPEYIAQKEAEERKLEEHAKSEERRATNRRKMGFKKTLRKYKRSYDKDERGSELGSRKNRVMAARR